MRHMDVDEGAIVHDLALGRMDKSHSTHISSQLVHLVELAACDCQRGFAVLSAAEVQQPKFVSRARAVLVLLDIHSANPVTLPLQFLDQMAADEPTCATHQCSLQEPSSLACQTILDFTPMIVLFGK